MKSFIGWYKGKLGSPTGTAAGALLVLRIVVGLALCQHGFHKIEHPMNWMGENAPVPGFFQFLAALSEFGGGIAWILGLLTPLASFGILCTMAVAVATHAGQGAPFVGGPPSYELALVYWSVALFILFNGPGRFSVDHKLCAPSNTIARTL